MNIRLLLAIASLPFVVSAEHEFACTDYTGRKVFLVGKDGKVTWEYETRQCNDLWVLPNGNLLFNTFNGVLEVTRDKKIVFEYTGSPVKGVVKQKGGSAKQVEAPSEIYACQRLANGNTFVGECNSGRLLEIAPDGKTIVKEVRTLPAGANGGHGYMRNARCLPNGNYLCCLYADAVVREYSPQGEIVREIKAPGGPHSAARLPNGNTLIAVGDKIKNTTRVETGLFEVDKNGKVVWQFTNDDLPGAPLKFMTGFHRLPNGNTVMSNWLGHGHLGKAPHLLEVTPGKKLVWTYENHKDMKTISSVVILAAASNAVH
ncbi:MAG: hypothetical protein FJ395_12300 [Verrucomicrobia bacterium]|nr:hypothetical protein [Verrucomicrobiota bacterium]